jgi:hypothetical protein
MNTSSFSHEALSLKGARPLIYTAMSKHYFYFRTHISKFVLEQGAVPLNPFMLFDYFLADSVDRNFVRQANNSIVLRSDEIWVFGPISNGVLAEIMLAQKARKPISYFKIEKPHAIIPTLRDDVEMESEVEQFRSSLEPHEECEPTTLLAEMASPRS